QRMPDRSPPDQSQGASNMAIDCESSRDDTVVDDFETTGGPIDFYSHTRQDTEKRTRHRKDVRKKKKKASTLEKHRYERTQQSSCSGQLPATPHDAPIDFR